MTEQQFHDPDYQDTRRCSFDLPVDLHDKLSSFLPYGTKKHFLVQVVKLAVEGMSEGGYAVVGAILQGDFNPLAEAIKNSEMRKCQQKETKDSHSP
jgi:hypothetical protein